MTITQTVELEVKECPVCGITYAIPKSLSQKKYNDGGEWYCPNGHSLVYTKPEHVRLAEELATVKRDRDWYKEQRERAQADVKHLEASRNAYKGQVTKIKARVGRGMCPCCNRFFENLHRHMNTKHPGFKEPEA